MSHESGYVLDKYREISQLPSTVLRSQVSVVS